MTNNEKAIVMAYTGYTMLTGEKLNFFYNYVEKLLGRPIYSHELADTEIIEEITRKSKEDFINLCKDDDDADYE